MGYQPMAEDQTADFIFQAYEQAGRNQLARQQMQMQQQGQTMQAMGQLGDVLQGWQQRSALKKQNLAEMEAWGASGLIPDEYLNKLFGEKDENKVAGQLSVLRYLGEMEGRKRLAAASDGSDAVANWVPSVVDVGEGTKAMMTSPRSAQLLPQGGTGATSRPRVVQGQDGFYVVDPTTGLAQPVMMDDGSPVVPRSGAPSAEEFKQRQNKLMSLDQDIADLQDELAKVRSGKGGWWARKPEVIMGEIEALEIKRKTFDR